MSSTYSKPPTVVPTRVHPLSEYTLQIYLLFFPSSLTPCNLLNNQTQFALHIQLSQVLGHSSEYTNSQWEEEASDNSPQPSRI